MLDKNQLAQYQTTELLLLQKHIRGGKEHLEKLLSKEEVSQIFHLASLSSHTQNKMKADNEEIIGSSLMTANGMIGAVLGAWGTISAFLRYHLSFQGRFMLIMAVTILIGVLVGWLNSRSIKNKAKEAFEKRALQEFERSIITEINSRRKNEIKEKIQEVYHVAKLIEITIVPFENVSDSPEPFYTWFSQMISLVKEKYQHEDSAKTLINKLEEMSISFKQKKQRGILHILNKLSRSLKEPKLVLRSWITSNYKDLILGFIPTLFGTFSSFLGRVGGSLESAQELGERGLFYFFTLPEIRVIGFSLSLAISIYFAATFVYINRKVFKRDQEIFKEQSVLTRDDEAMSIYDDKLLKLKEALSYFYSFAFNRLTLINSKE